ncbi:MAG: Gfo/Idh/MocA family oxidoreductase [Verrucomicrobiota bacterium]
MTKPHPKIRAGLIGCGDIARNAYLPFLKDYRDQVEVTTCTDVRQPFAEDLASGFGISTVAPTIEALLEDQSIDLILNLTHPAAHASINYKALEAGKHAYCEKPFALTREEGKAVLEKAKEKGLKVGCAPDTVLGTGTQSARHLIEQGEIGKALFARCNLLSAGHEHWHSNPDFYYQEGGGPLLDMGPYYLSTLIQCLGPIRSVQGRAMNGFTERTITSEPLNGKTIQVNTPTYYSGSLETVGGVLVDLEFSFDHKFRPGDPSCVEFHGTEGSLISPDPNGFEGEILINREYPPKPYTAAQQSHSYSGGRGLGLLDMVQAITEDRGPRASGAIAYHVLDCILAFHDSEESGTRITIDSSCEQPMPMAVNGL